MPLYKDSPFVLVYIFHSAFITKQTMHSQAWEKKREAMHKISVVVVG